MTTETPPELKMWLAVRRDLDLSAGKMAGQSGHAFGRLYLEAKALRPGPFEEYIAAGETKVVVRVDSEAALLRVFTEAEDAGLPCQLIRDAGKTELEPGTATCCAFGPTTRDALPKYLQRLQLF